MSPPAIAGVSAHHVSLSVPDLDQAIAFWSENFGFALRSRIGIPGAKMQGAFIGIPGLMIELWQVDGALPMPEARKDPASDLLTYGTKHLGLRVPDVQVAIDALHARGVPIVAVQRRFDEPMRHEADPTTGALAGRPPAVAAFIAEPAGALVEIIAKAPFE